MIDAGWTRKLVNQRVGRVKRVFKWAASEQLIPVATFAALATVTGLQAGRTAAQDRAPVELISDAAVDATLPHLNRHVRGLVEFQRFTGCRPGEVCAIRWCDIDMTSDVWFFRPGQHKTAWRGKSRVIAIGPRAQEVLKWFPTAEPTEYIFNPRRAVEELHATRAANRKTPRYASHMKRNAKVRKANPKRKPAEKYTVTAYEHAIARACVKAFPLPTGLAPRVKESEEKWWERLKEDEREAVRAWRRERRWAPNQLRHTHATAVRKRFGLEAAQVALGHANAAITEVYAEKNAALAAQVAAQIG